MPSVQVGMTYMLHSWACSSAPFAISIILLQYAVHIFVQYKSSKVKPPGNVVHELQLGPVEFGGHLAVHSIRQDRESALQLPSVFQSDFSTCSVCRTVKC